MNGLKPAARLNAFIPADLKYLKSVPFFRFVMNMYMYAMLAGPFVTIVIFSAIFSRQAALMGLEEAGVNVYFWHICLPGISIVIFLYT